MMMMMNALKGLIRVIKFLTAADASLKFKGCLGGYKFAVDRKAILMRNAVPAGDITPADTPTELRSVCRTRISSVHAQRDGREFNNTQTCRLSTSSITLFPNVMYIYLNKTGFFKIFYFFLFFYYFFI
jgi:hypothetical protein